MIENPDKTQKWWCNVHHRTATHLDRFGNPCCVGPGIMLPCAADLIDCSDWEKAANDPRVTESVIKGREAWKKFYDKNLNAA